MAIEQMVDSLVFIDRCWFLEVYKTEQIEQ